MRKILFAIALAVLSSKAHASFSAKDFISQNGLVENTTEAPVGKIAGNAYINPNENLIPGFNSGARLASIWFTIVDGRKFAVGNLNFGGTVLSFKAPLGDVISSGKYKGFRAGSGQLVAKYGLKSCSYPLIVILNRSQFDKSGIFSVQVIASNSVNQFAMVDVCPSSSEDIFENPGNPVFERFDVKHRAIRNYDL